MSSTNRQEKVFFRAIEETFIRLRGSPFLLSPADWQLAQTWHQREIPLELILAALEAVFARRTERGHTGRVQGLRYCAEAVEQAWAAQAELTAPARRRKPSRLDIDARLGALASALPEELDGGERLRARIRSLAGSTEEVEAALSKLDDELLVQVLDSMDPGVRIEIRSVAQGAIERLGERVPVDQVGTLRDRLERDAVRRRFGLPLLSLFAPDAGA